MLSLINQVPNQRYIDENGNWIYDVSMFFPEEPLFVVDKESTEKYPEQEIHHMVCEFVKLKLEMIFE